MVPLLKKWFQGCLLDFPAPLGKLLLIFLPPASPSASSMEEYDSIEVHVEQLLSLDRRLGEFERYLEKDSSLAQATIIVNRLRTMLDKDHRGIELLRGLVDIINTHVLAYNPNLGVTQDVGSETTTEYLEVLMPKVSVYMAEMGPSTNTIFVLEKTQIFKVNKVP